MSPVCPSGESEVYHAGILSVLYAVKVCIDASINHRYTNKRNCYTASFSIFSNKLHNRQMSYRHNTICDRMLWLCCLEVN